MSIASPIWHRLMSVTSRRIVCVLASLCFICVLADSLRAQPANWADANLDVRQSLILWLDASRINAERAASKTESIPDSGRVSRWADGSGNACDFSQANESDQPKLVRVGESWTVRFDGESDSMRAKGTPHRLADATLFFVVSPHENRGDFCGFFAANAPNRRDYESGFNLDLGPSPTRQFDQLNVEGQGFSGFRDMYEKSMAFGTLQTIEVQLNHKLKSVNVYVNGIGPISRPYVAENVSFEELTLGARFYTNGPGDHIVRGNLKCDIAEVIAYDRLLTDEEMASIRKYLASKYKSLADELPNQLKLGDGASVLVKAENPPNVQMLVPGFRVFELPVELTNVNNVRYRDDGKLMTLGYNGDIHLLSDSDGDGLEDKAELFWKNEGSLRGPIGLQLTPANYSKGRGAFLPSKGKVSLIVDTDGDDKADKEIVVASGWQEITQNVDAVGIAMAPDGSIYFGLGTANYANAYLIDQDGTSGYQLSSDRGTVQRISPELDHRETVCTGIRFPIAFGFNRLGDLFCTEQEGATWLANGNPFDELLHIEPKRHYGFPPRHPVHNPNVIDEPSTFDYGPQHQSTCGMVFNEPVNNGPVFGPELWAGNAIVTGESRGKIWRTQLVKTENGYVASSQLLACLQMLTVDVCVAPNGDLIVACHSGPPDWGTGPTGIGKLFRIQVEHDSEPRPVATWAESPNELRIAFDKPLDPLQLKNLKELTSVEYGDHVRAGDRFENLVPPYAVVHKQSMMPRRKLEVAGVSITNDLRTLILSTSKLIDRSHFAITLPKSARVPVDTSSILLQHPQIDVDGSNHGIQAHWRSSSITPSGEVDEWVGWLPHIDLQVAKEMTRGSAHHDLLWQKLALGGELHMRTKVDLASMLRPLVQPGATLDYQWPAENVTMTIGSNVALQAELGSNVARNERDKNDGVNKINFIVDEASTSNWIDLSLRLQFKEGVDLKCTVTTSTNEDAKQRPMPLRRFFMPWVEKETSGQNDSATSEKIAELEGGSWGRGRRVFHSEAASCSKCHSIGAGGATIGPDLSNLVHRDYASVARDIIHPSFAINPDFIGHVIAMNDGTVLTGVLRNEHGKLLLGDSLGKTTPIDQSQIEQMKSAQASIMPTGLREKLTAEQWTDLMTYLLTSPPHMPLDSPLKAPPIRTQAEVAALLAGAPPKPESLRALHVVLVAGQKDHGPGEHDYPAWLIQWGQLLTAAENVSVSGAWDFPSEDQLAHADVLIFFQKGTWNDERQSKMDHYLASGRGAVYVHWAVNGDERVADFSKRIGLASRGGNIRYRHGPLSLAVYNTEHPIMRNMKPMELYDESYWLLTGEPANVTLFASSLEDGVAQPQVWAYEKGDGRVFVSIPGHYSWTFDDPLFRTLLLRGIAWTGKESVDRFNELVPLGARMSR